jgi:hypothetical protein
MALPPIASGCAVTYSRFRATPGEDWSYVVASTAIELPSSMRITTSAYGGTMVGTEDNFMLTTDIAMISRQILDINSPELAAVVGVQPLPPGKYALNNIGFYANAWKSWSISRSVAPSYLEVPAKSVIYVGSYIATRSGSMRVANEEERDLRIAVLKNQKLSTLPLIRRVPSE